MFDHRLKGGLGLLGKVKLPGLTALASFVFEAFTW
jgi:hypothetical protein